MALHAFIVERSGSQATADGYLERIGAFLASFDTFPERGTVRDEIRAGVRLVGFERSVTVAFVVEDPDVVVLRLLPGGQEFIP